MRVIRIAIIWSQEPWRGAVNYYRNLCYAVSQLPNAKVEIVFFAGNDVNTYDIENYVEVIRCPFLTRKSVPWFFWKLGVKLKRDYILYQLMRKHQIDVISHHQSLWQGCPIPSAPWWADFQFLRLPDMFTEKHAANLTASLKRMCCNEKHILLSSHDAKHDFEMFTENAVSPSVHVLPFVSALVELAGLPEKSELIERYKLPDLWFYLPNQFWKHKNHMIVVDALGKMKQTNKNICVVATGKTEDFRNPEYYQALVDKVESLGVESNFISLGEIPFKDVVALLQYSIAVINPSLFEGWSTTVEESKAMGKKVVLSDIAVHREQNPLRGTYFHPQNAGELANILKTVMAEYSVELEANECLKAKSEYEKHIEKFALNYEKIMSEVVL